MSFKSHKELLEALLTKKKIVDVHDNTLELDKEYKLVGTFKPSYQPEDKHLLTFLNPTNWSFKKATQLVNGIEVGVPSTLKDFSKGEVYYPVHVSTDTVFIEVIGDNPTKDELYFSLCVCFITKQDAEDFLKASKSKVKEVITKKEEVYVTETIHQDVDSFLNSMREASILQLFEVCEDVTLNTIIGRKALKFTKPPYGSNISIEEAKDIIRDIVEDLCTRGVIGIHKYSERYKSIGFYSLAPEKDV